MCAWIYLSLILHKDITFGIIIFPIFAYVIIIAIPDCVNFFVHRINIIKDWLNNRNTSLY